MMTTIDDVLSFIQQSKTDHLDDLFKLLRFQSVSTDISKKDQLLSCANYLLDFFNDLGATDTKLIQTQQHPVVYAEFFSAKEKPTVLIYGHYDVQPEDPLELWHSLPFEPEIRDGYIYARGVADNKGQFLSHIKAVSSWLKVSGECPVNIKFLIEGEEEIGSPNLPGVLDDYRDLFSADIAVVSDSPMYASGQPVLSCSLRGLVYLELIVNGPNKDLHSGQFGGVVRNPIQALASVISKLKDEYDKVLIPGFYDDIDMSFKLDSNYYTPIKSNDETLKKQVGVSELVGLKEYTADERKWFLPTLDCNGIVGGYIESGAKTIIPSTASAKISMRLVSHQDPHRIMALFKSYVDSVMPSGVSYHINDFNVAFPASINTSNPFFNAARVAFKDIYHKDPYVVGEGGSIPVVADLKRILGLDTVMMGFNLPDDAIHSPNERFGLDNFFNGIEVSARFLDLVSRL